MNEPLGEDAKELDLTREPAKKKPRSPSEQPQTKDGSLDLTEEPTDETVPEPSTVPYNADEDRERIRGFVAISLIALLAVVIIVAFVSLMTGTIVMRDLKEMLTIVFAPLVALVGAATGFYFGGKK